MLTRQQNKIKLEVLEKAQEVLTEWRWETLPPATAKLNNQINFNPLKTLYKYQNAYT